MNRSGSMNAYSERTKWRRVSTAFPCPICHKPDYCGIATDGSVCIC